MRDNIRIITIKYTDICTANNWSRIEWILKMTPHNKSGLGLIDGDKRGCRSCGGGRIVPAKVDTRVGSERRAVSNFSSFALTQLVTLIHPDPRGRRRLNMCFMANCSWR